MISLVLTANGDAKALVRLLAALVPAAAEGLVREVAVIGARDLCAELAIDAGADVYAEFAEAAAKARGPWLAELPLAALLTRDWMELIGEHLARDPAAPARLVARRAWLGLAREGWLVPKSLVGSAVAVEEDLQRLARRGGRRLYVLDRR